MLPGSSGAGVNGKRGDKYGVQVEGYKCIEINVLAPDGSMERGRGRRGGGGRGRGREDVWCCP